MHYRAEYGSASHWRYKDTVKALPPSGPAAQPPHSRRADTQPNAHLLPPTEGPPLTPKDYHSRVRPGQPALCIDNGQARDAVITHVLEDTHIGVVAATTLGRRWREGAAPMAPLRAADYAALHSYVHHKGWTQPGQNDGAVAVRFLAQCWQSACTQCGCAWSARRPCTTAALVCLRYVSSLLQHRGCTKRVACQHLSLCT